MGKKFKGAVSALAMCLAVSLALTACGGKTETKKKDPSSPAEAYDITKRTPTDEGETVVKLNNADYKTYHNYIDVPFNGVSYSVGDPFIMRHGNRYYLYCSTPVAAFETTRRKIGVWRSDNLVDWTQLGWAYDPDTDPDGLVFLDKGNPKETPTEGAFAPEVIYYKGWFYMCESQNGHGHYFLRSKTPEGPFRVISENEDLGIDGSFALSDDGSLWFVSANSSRNAISAVPIDFEDGPSGDIKDCKVVLDKDKIVDISSARLGGWTEGPGFFSRNGYHYMTYTGNHVESASYRVGYSYTKSKSPLEGLMSVWDNVILESSGMDEEALVPYNSVTGSCDVTTFRGTGHSSNAVGPNIDSIYTAFHIANRVDHKNAAHDVGRRLAITQYFTNGAYVLTNGIGNYERPQPSMPDFMGDVKSLESLGGMKVSPESTKDVYTAELSLKLSGGKGSVIFGATDASNYVEALIDGDTLTLNQIKNGRSKSLGEAQISTSTNADSEHIVKLVNGSSKAVLYYDNMAVINLSTPLSSGKIGFGNGTPCTLAFTNDAFGTSDFETVKDLRGGSWPAYAYMKEENRGFSLAKGKVTADGVRQGEKETTKKVASPEARSLVLSAGDWIKYTVNAPAAGLYALNMTAGKDSAGAVFEAIVDNETIFLMDTPTKDDFGKAKYANVHAGNFEIKEQGVHTLKIRVYSGTLDALSFSAERGASTAAEANDPLTDRANTVFRSELGTPSVTQQGIVTSAADPRTLVLTGNKGNGNYEFSVKVRLLANGSCGVLFRMNDYSYTNSGTVKLGTNFSGYFLEIQRSSVRLSKRLYDKQKALASAKTSGQLFSATPLKVTVKAVNGRISVSIEDEQVIDVFDKEAFLTGYIGLYAEDQSSMMFNSFTYKDIIGGK